jgi:ubiquinone/menaquinone biosynthesis C-methylase UbiE
MFAKTAEWYDAVYDFKDYAAEAGKLRGLIQQHKQSPGKRLLDVACGTGRHIELLRADYDCEGLDLEPELLKVARQRLPDVPLHQGDMTNFDLGRRFDIVTCLFGAIAYVETVERLRAAIAAMVRHLVSGGVLIVEPFISPDNFGSGRLGFRSVEQADLMIARMTDSRVEDRMAVMVVHYLVGIPGQGVQYFAEDHRLGLFMPEETEEAFTASGLSVIYDPVGFEQMARGLFVGVKP